MSTVKISLYPPPYKSYADANMSRVTTEWTYICIPGEVWVGGFELLPKRLDIVALEDLQATAMAMVGMNGQVCVCTYVWDTEFSRPQLTMPQDRFSGANFNSSWISR